MTGKQNPTPKADAAELQNKLAEAQAAHDGLQAKLTAALSAQSAAEQQAAALKDQVAELRGENASLQQQLAAAQAEKRSAEQELAELQALTEAGLEAADEIPATARVMTAADAVQLVRRKVVIEDGGASQTITKPIALSEVLTFKDHGTHVVVVTKDGQKFSSVDA